MSIEGEHQFLRTISSTEAIKLFVDVSKRYPAHALIQAVAIVKDLRSCGVDFQSYGQASFNEIFYLTIHRAASKQVRHERVAIPDVGRVILLHYKWGNLAQNLDEEKIEIILTEYWEKYLQLRDVFSYKNAYAFSAIELIIEFFPSQKKGDITWYFFLNYIFLMLFFNASKRNLIDYPA